MNFFKPKQTIPPISEEVSSWMNEAFKWMISEFGEDKFFNTQPFLLQKPTYSILYAEKYAYDYLKRIAAQMELNEKEVCIQFTENQFSDQNGRPIFPYSMKLYDSEANSAALLAEKNAEGKFTINIDKNELADSSKLISTLAHGLAQIKILSEGRTETNDEYLTDLVTVFFGFGIYGANNAFVFSSNLDSWTFSRKGYFTPQEWGYALALYASLRKEKSVFYQNHLSGDVRLDFKKAYRFINNQGNILEDKI